MSTRTARLAAAPSDAVAIRALLAAVAAGYRARDAAAVAKAYAPDATIASLAPPLVTRGLDPAGLQAWFDGRDAPVELEHRDLAVEAAGDLGLVHGLVRTSTRRADDEAAWWARMTLGLTRTRQGWRISHEHGSVPFHMEGDPRAALDLEPTT